MQSLLAILCDKMRLRDKTKEGMISIPNLISLNLMFLLKYETNVGIALMLNFLPTDGCL